MPRFPSRHQGRDVVQGTRLPRVPQSSGRAAYPMLPVVQQFHDPLDLIRHFSMA
jgi:hypothetical protein